MSPKEPLNLPFRWEFVPQENSDRSVRWRWRAWAHTGALVMESPDVFETLTECVDNARTQGYTGTGN